MTVSKIKIGISLRVTNAEQYSEIRDALSHDWPLIFEKMNIFPVLIPNAISNVGEFLEKMQLDGFLLSGGDNIGDNVDRDKTEQEIIRFGLEYNLPIFGVCRGMQVINKYFHGEIETLTNSMHVGNPHSVKIINSSFSTLLKTNSIKVNSYHNNIIKQDILGDELEPFAISPKDETIEGFFHKKFPIVGVMWHPERDQHHNSKIILRKVFHDKNFWS
tara:strand:- start:367 stop:1017 length:651 start_codon:yes stop_codon:yes gene_type:complete